MDEVGLEDIVDAADAMIEKFEDHDDVTYAEVGGVYRRRTDAVVTDDGVRTASDVDASGIWWRSFTEGSADYRWTTNLTEEHLDDWVGRSVRSGQMLAQERPARYDRGSMHRATHPGWGDDSLSEQDATEKADRVAAAIDSVDLSRARVTYADEHTDLTLLTTTGTTLHQTLERASVESFLEIDGETKVHDHTGATTGTAFLEEIPAHLDAAVDRAAELSTYERGTINAASDRAILFGPAAAGELFHQLSHYLELDMVYFESSPFRVGDRIAPDVLDVEDTVHAGSWAAMAYDAEGRPTQPTSLIDSGEVKTLLTDTAGAIEEDLHPPGCLVPSLGFQNPPRIHARHLDVAPGEHSREALAADADVVVERVGTPIIGNEATRTKRSSTMPPSTLYARDIGEMTPGEYSEEATEQVIELPIREGYVVESGTRTELLRDARIEFTPQDLQSLAGLGSARNTVTGTCEKHESTLPYAVTAPAALFTCTVRPH